MRKRTARKPSENRGRTERKQRKRRENRKMTEIEHKRDNIERAKK